MIKTNSFHLGIVFAAAINLLVTPSLGQEHQPIRVRSADPCLTEPILRPTSLAVDGDDNIYVIDSLTSRVLRIEAESRRASVIAGCGKKKATPDRVSARFASLNPTAIAPDRTGNLYIAEIDGTIFRLDVKTGMLTRVVGGQARSAVGSNGGAALESRLQAPGAIALDSKGNLFISDTLAHRVRRVDARSGVITTVAGGGSGPLGDGGSATSATLKFPFGIAFDKNDNLFIADRENHRIRRVDSQNGIITTLAPTGSDAMQESGLSTNPQLSYPTNIAIDRNGNLFITGGAGHVILRLDWNDFTIAKYAGLGNPGLSGDNGPATHATLYGPSGLAVDEAGNLFLGFSEWENQEDRRPNRANNNGSLIATGINYRAFGGYRSYRPYRKGAKLPYGSGQ